MKSNPTISLIILVIILAGVAYWYVAGQSDTQLPLTATVAENEMQTRFKMLVSEISAISLDDTGIFSDPTFAALTDLTTPVAPESPGRLDPFAPIGEASARDE